MPVYYSRQETVGHVEADKLFMLTTFIFEIIFGKNYDHRTSERLKLTADLLSPGAIRLYALIARGFNEKKSHIVEHHKRNGYPRTTHPKYEGGSKHLHDLKDSWHYFVEDYTTTHESGGFTVDLESVTQDEELNAEQELLDTCGLWICVARNPQPDPVFREPVFG